VGGICGFSGSAHLMRKIIYKYVSWLYRMNNFARKYEEDESEDKFKKLHDQLKQWTMKGRK
jgi:hypothetical protein